MVGSTIGSPAAAIRRAVAANRETKPPVRKNVAGTCAPCSVARIEATASSLAPASNVSATTLRVAGVYVQSVPASQAGNAIVPGDTGCKLGGAGGAAPGADAGVDPVGRACPDVAGGGVADVCPAPGCGGAEVPRPGAVPPHAARTPRRMPVMASRDVFARQDRFGL